jgi:hypothetical protein
MEARMAGGEEIDIDRFQRTSNSLRRLCESLGLERKPEHVPTIVEYAARWRAEQARQGAEDADTT